MEDVDRSVNVDEISARLSDWDARIRHQAREQLVHQGQSALPLLLKKLSAPDWHIRWEAAKALGEIGDAAAIEPLVKLLQDDDTSVRWAAMGSLIQIGRPSLHALLLAITREFHSARFRQGAHHILHTLYNQGKLTAFEAQVFRALEGHTTGIQAAEAANKILIAEYIYHK